MRKIILCSLAAASLACAGHAVATVGSSATSVGMHTDGINNALAGKVSQVQVPGVQALFNGSSFNGTHQVVARGASGFDTSQSVIGDLLPAEGSSSGSMLLAGALVVVAVVLRRLS